MADAEWHRQYRANRTAKIARLEAENAEMRDKLTEIANYAPEVTHGWANHVRSIARNAIGEKQ